MGGPPGRVAPHWRTPGQVRAPAMNQFTAKRAFIQTPAHAIGEADQNAFLYRIGRRRLLLDGEAFVLGDSQELFQ